MKKAIYLLMLCAGFVLASCQKEEIGGTATEALAGEWVVFIDAVDASGQVVYEDPYGVGASRVYTYNTAANTPDVIFLEDQGWFWEYKCKVNCDVEKLTFSATGSEDYYNGIDVNITDGKVTVNGTTTPSGMPADAIEFYVTFSDDDYIGVLYDRLYVHGFRYTGLVADEL